MPDTAAVIRNRFGFLVTDTAYCGPLRSGGWRRGPWHCPVQLVLLVPATEIGQHVTACSRQGTTRKAGPPLLILYGRFAEPLLFRAPLCEANLGNFGLANLVRPRSVSICVGALPMTTTGGRSEAFFGRAGNGERVDVILQRPTSTARAGQSSSCNTRWRSATCRRNLERFGHQSEATGCHHLPSPGAVPLRAKPGIAASSTDGCGTVPARTGRTSRARCSFTATATGGSASRMT